MTCIIVEVKLQFLHKVPRRVVRRRAKGEGAWWECVRCECVVDGHGDPAGSPSLDQVCDVGLEWQVTSTVTHNLHSIHPLHVYTHTICPMHTSCKHIYDCLHGKGNS